MSFVDRHPSTERQSKVSATACASARCSVSASASASVVTTASIVAIAGDNIAAPLAMPPTVAAPARATASFANVSVVMIAQAARPPPSAASSPHSFGSPTSSASIGIGMPMRPVEHTSTSAVSAPRPPAASSHMRCASRRPGSPVAALALPELNTTAAAVPSARWRREICTGAAWARLVVNTPAAVTAARSSVATSARSAAPDGLIPHARPPATKPGAAVTPVVTAGSRAAAGPWSRAFPTTRSRLGSSARKLL